MAWIYGLTGLLVFQLLGEMSVRLLHLPVPGPVVGMLLLLGWLFWRGDTPPAMDQTAKGLLTHLSLLFVPAGVGAMVYAEELLAHAWAVALTLTAGTVLTLIVTAWVAQKTQRKPMTRTGGAD